MIEGSAHTVISIPVTPPSPTPICIMRGVPAKLRCRVLCWLLLGRSAPTSQHSTTSPESLITKAVMRDFCGRGSALSAEYWVS